MLAAVATATMPVLLSADHLAGRTAYDLLAWAGLALIAARIGRTGEARWRLAGGLVLGLGWPTSTAWGLFAVALVIGALLSGGLRLVWNRWFAAAALIAAAFTIPDLWWQAGHQWATIAITRALSREDGGPGNIGTWVASQLLMTALALVRDWAAGCAFCGGPGGRWPGRTGCRSLFFAVTVGAKIYHLAGAYVYLLAAGAVAVDGWLAARPGLAPPYCWPPP